MKDGDDATAADRLRLLLALCLGPRGGVRPDDGPALAAAAFRHGLAPLLYHRIAAAAPAGKAAPAPAAPAAATRAALRAGYLRTLGTNLRAREQLADIVAIFASRDIRPALLKGAHLAYAVYPDPGTRPMCDLDLLVRPHDVPAAAAALRELGYAPITPYFLDAERAHSAHLPAFVAPGRLPVELHWRLLRPSEPYRVDAAALLARARPCSAALAGALALDPADAFLHVALHAIVNDRLGGGARALVDLALLAAATPGDPAWIEAGARARAAGAGRVHGLALALLAALLPAAPVCRPPPVDAATPQETEALSCAIDLLLDPADGGGDIAPNLAAAFGGNPLSSARLLVARAFPSRSEMGVLSPAPETPEGRGARAALKGLLRYPRRWALLVARHGPVALRLLRGCGPERSRAARLNRGGALAEWCAQAGPESGGRRTGRTT